MAVYAQLADRTAPRKAITDALVVGNPLPVTAPISPGLPVPVLKPLPDAEREAREVAACYQTAPLLGADATTKTVLARLRTCQIAHFATHGMYGSDDEGTPGNLCLSPAGDDDGYLSADDIKNLDLSQCQLAVLSACQTGWGRSSYEGSLGLARTLLGAGVPAIVVSLWPVGDASTADLMIAFHQHLRAGLDAGEALRLSMLAARDREAPVSDWAGFTIVGDPTVRITIIGEATTSTSSV